MAAFASSGAAASGLTRSTQRSALVLQRLLPQIGEATPRLPCLQAGRLGFTTATAPRRQLCCARAAQSRRDMSAHAAAVSALLHRTRPLKTSQRVGTAHAPPPRFADTQHSQRRRLLAVDQHWGHTLPSIRTAVAPAQSSSRILAPTRTASPSGCQVAAATFRWLSVLLLCCDGSYVARRSLSLPACMILACTGLAAHCGRGCTLPEQRTAGFLKVDEQLSA